MEPVFILELIIVAIIVGIQFRVFRRNLNSVRELAEVFPPANELEVFDQVVTESDNPSDIDSLTFSLIRDEESFSPTFRDILHTTNAYLIKNQGAAETETLQEIAERMVISSEKSIESNIALPLYIGLLCTFTGVIIGLVKIAIHGVSDAAIQTFIGGVLIGMVGSAVGLALTVRSNYQFRESRRKRDRKLYEYFNFLRASIIPSRFKESVETLSSFRDNLSAFNQGFVRYQQHMNESLSDTLKMFGELKEVFSKLRVIKDGLVGMGEYLRANDGLLDKQFACMDAYARKAEALTEKLERHHAYVDAELAGLMNEKMRQNGYHTQAAYQQVDYYLSGEANGHSLTYAEAIDRDMSGIRNDLHHVRSQYEGMSGELMDKLEAERHSLVELTDQVREMNSRMAMAANIQGRQFINSGLFKGFVIAGLVAFSAMVVSGGIYLFNLIIS